MASNRKETPDFFEDNALDPVETATGYGKRFQKDAPPGSSTANKGKPRPAEKNAANTVAKKKAGFYISATILERFTRKFYELKLAGVGIENKSTLLELALSFALDDIDRGSQSRILQSFGT